MKFYVLGTLSFQTNIFQRTLCFDAKPVLDFGFGFKESELHSGRKGFEMFEIPIEILLKSQSLEANVLQRPLLSSGKNVDDVLGTFWDLGMAWVAKKWPEKATREQKWPKKSPKYN